MKSNIGIRFVTYNKRTGEIDGVNYTSHDEAFENLPLEKEYYCSVCDDYRSENSVRYKINTSLVNGDTYTEVEKDEDSNLIENQVLTCPECGNTTLVEESNQDKMFVSEDGKLPKNHPKAGLSEDEFVKIQNNPSRFKVNSNSKKVERKPK